MDAEMAFLMVNQGLAQPVKLVYDPFVGTGSILVAAAHFGAMTMGADIDIRVVQYGKGPDCNVWSNFKQGRFLSSLCTQSPTINVVSRSTIHGLVASGGDDGAVECFDTRKKSSVGRINTVMPDGGADQEVTAVQFDENHGYFMADRTSAGKRGCSA